MLSCFVVVEFDCFMIALCIEFASDLVPLLLLERELLHGIKPGRLSHNKPVISSITASISGMVGNGCL